MKQRLKVLIVALGVVVALAAVPALSFAQQGGNPPPPPAAFIYGQVSGGTVGQPVIAFIRTNGTSMMCGVGTVKNQPGTGTVYELDVESASRISGCGASGRQVRMYFGRVGNTPGRFATQTVTLTSNQFQTHQMNVTLGGPLSHRVVAPAMGAQVSR